MIVLAVDTATTACSVAVWCDGNTLAHSRVDMSRGHAEALFPLVANTLAAAHVAARDVDLFAVTVGPGAFTGLRVGLAAARGMALAAGRPCIGISTLEAVAASVPAAERSGRSVVAALDSRRGDLFVQGFAADGTPLGAPRVVHPGDLAAVLPGGPLIVAGDAAAAVLEALADRPDVVAAPAAEVADAGVVAALAAGRQAEERGPNAPPEPLYLRDPAAVRPAAGGRRRP